MKLKIRRNICKAIVILLGLILLSALLLSLLSNWESRHSTVDVSESYGPDDGRVSLNGSWYVPNENLNVILLIGVDKYKSQTESESYNNNQQADFLMLLLMDEQSETYTALHLNRDTMTDITVLGVRGENAGTTTGQLALAHTYGDGGHKSCRNTVDAVSNLLYGIEIDHYIAVTMDAVPVINDLAGGVTLTILDDMTSVSPKLQEGATVTLTGEQALAYVRTRYGLEDSTNISRMERQRQYLSELRNILSAKMAVDDTFLLDVINQTSLYMISDCTANQLSRMYEQWGFYVDGGIKTIEGEAKTGDEYMEFYPDEESLKQLVVDLFYVSLEE